MEFNNTACAGNSEYSSNVSSACDLDVTGGAVLGTFCYTVIPPNTSGYVLRDIYPNGQCNDTAAFSESYPIETCTIIGEDYNKLLDVPSKCC